MKKTLSAAGEIEGFVKNSTLRAVCIHADRARYGLFYSTIYIPEP